MCPKSVRKGIIQVKRIQKQKNTDVDVVLVKDDFPQQNLKNIGRLYEYWTPPPYHITYTEEQDEYILQAQEEIRNDEHKNGFWETKGSAKTKRCAKSDDKYQRLLKCIMPPTISRVWRIRRNINAL